MEKYYKVSDVNEILNKLVKEPSYQHSGEDFYAGVYTVEAAFIDLDAVVLEEPSVAKWLFTNYAGGEYYKCSCCGKDYPLPPTWTAYDIKKYLRYCSYCGAKMVQE